MANKETATPKKRKYSPKPKKNLPDTGAMDEFLETVIGETIQEDKIVTRKPKKKTKEKEPEPVAQEPETTVQETEPVVQEPEPVDSTVIVGTVEETVSDLCIDKDSPYPLFDNPYAKFFGPELVPCQDETECPEGQEEIQVDRITAVTDKDGNPLYYKVPADCEELDGVENWSLIKDFLTKIIADSIYRKHNETIPTVEIKVADLTPDVVAPKTVFPFRVVDKW